MRTFLLVAVGLCFSLLARADEYANVVGFVSLDEISKPIAIYKRPSDSKPLSVVKAIDLEVSRIGDRDRASVYAVKSNSYLVRQNKKFVWIRKSAAGAFMSF